MAHIKVLLESVALAKRCICILLGSVGLSKGNIDGFYVFRRRKKIGQKTITRVIRPIKRKHIAIFMLAFKKVYASESLVSMSFKKERNNVTVIQ